MKHVFRAILALIVAANSLGLVTLFSSQQALRQIYPDLEAWMVPVLALLSLASMAACVALWSWRRWGFALLFAAYALMLAINLRFGAPLAHTALGPLGLIVLAGAAWPVRALFRPPALPQE